MPLVEQPLTKQQRKSTEEHDGAILQALHSIAMEMRVCLELGNLDAIWQEKRCLAPGVSTDFIDACYTLTVHHGASASTITGAGGGGFLLLYSL